MAGKNIQEQFGDTIIDAVRQFCRADLDDVPRLEANLFGHIGDPQARRVLAETLYGARWVYKLGLALLVRDVEQLAHVRAQVIDYGSICEGLLHDVIRHAFARNIMAGNKYRFSDTRNLRWPIQWANGVDINLNRQKFFWFIDVSEEENIISNPLATRLHSLRAERNTVHLRSRTYKAFLGTSRRAYATLLDTAAETQAWKAAHP